MYENYPVISVITPTTGKDSLFNLIESLTRQQARIIHFLIWDDIRQDHFLKDMKPEDLDKREYFEKYGYLVNNIIIKGRRINTAATGSALRAIGLISAVTDIVTFADDDVVWEDNHLSTMMEAMKNHEWAFCKRKIWTINKNNTPEYLGIDEFESVGEDAKTPYKMVDNNCMMFKRRYGSSAAPLYRETNEYNDDRLFYNFLKQYAGEPGKTNLATINQVCPTKLVDFFKNNCTK
jgi:hypothetical protein